LDIQNNSISEKGKVYYLLFLAVKGKPYSKPSRYIKIRNVIYKLTDQQKY